MKLESAAKCKPMNSSRANHQRELMSFPMDEGLVASIINLKPIVPLKPAIIHEAFPNFEPALSKSLFSISPVGTLIRKMNV